MIEEGLSIFDQAVGHNDSDPRPPCRVVDENLSLLMPGKLKAVLYPQDTRRWPELLRPAAPKPTRYLLSPHSSRPATCVQHLVLL